MKKIVFIFALISLALFAGAESIYDVQFTEDPSGDSPYTGQVVTLTGIVTANNWNGNDIYISSPEGGAWNGIFIYSPTITAELGDEISVTAEVAEYYGMTELTNIENMEVISTGNPVPAPAVITTSELASSEAYESVLVEVEDVTATVEPNNYGESYIDDGSGECQADDHMFAFAPAVGDEFASITGIVAYSYDEYELNPRTADDVAFGGLPAFILGNVELDGGTGDIEEVVVSIDGFSTNPSASGDYVLEVPAGTWDVTASLNGYIPVTQTDITVEEGGTITDLDFVLSPLPEATIYDIQYTEDPSGDSPFVDQEVTVTGIVTGAGFNNNNYFFMSTPEGGAWNGIYVYQFDYEVAVGDEVTLTGTVSEYYGLTEIGYITALTINSSGNPVPAPVELTTAELSSTEAYESVLCKINDVIVTVEANENGEVYVTDGSGDCQVDDGFVSNPALVLGAEFESITGIVDYSYDEYGLHPRSMEDFVTGTQPEAVPIYDIQFTEDPSGDSPYADQEVIVNGIVTGFGFSGDNFFLSSTEGGAWNGIYVYQYDYTVAEGDDVTLTGTVQEYYGFTEIGSVTSLTINSSGNALPAPVMLTTAELASTEAYEGVLVQVENAEVTVAPNDYGEAYIDDGSGEAQLDDGFFTYPGLAVGDMFDSITGLVDYSYDEYAIHPRYLEDFEIEIQPEVVTIHDIQFTEDPEGDSPYVDQLVQTTGTVVGTGFSGGSYFFISTPEGGAWNGLYVYQFDYEVAVGDIVTITGIVSEYYGFTELGSVSELTIDSSGNPLPDPVLLTTAELASSEAYESVLVQVENVEVTADPNEYGEAYIDDGTGECQLDDGFITNPDVVLGAQFVSIIGLIDYSYSEYAINPRSLDDFTAGPQYIYGDVTGDEIVDSFDAANILQYAVSMDPSGAPLPWTWELIAGDVDGNGTVEAYDAALILQYSVGMIDQFPVETRTDSPLAEITLSYIEGNLVFNANDEFYSAVVNIASNDVVLGNASADGDFLSAFNDNENSYAVASAEIISGQFLSIPCEILNDNGFVTITSSVNGITSEKTYRIIDLTSGQIAENNAVLGNYPNPFNPVTTIKLAVAADDTPVRVDIYNVKGQLVETLYNGSLDQGIHNLTWNADNAESASGIFFYKAQIADQNAIGKMIMLK